MCCAIAPITRRLLFSVLLLLLQDTLSFMSAVKQALPTISQLLGSKTSSDILEAINFFVAGFEFGVSDTMLGIRRMLLLMWSKEQSVREAVVSAYRRLYLRADTSNNR